MATFLEAFRRALNNNSWNLRQYQLKNYLHISYFVCFMDSSYYKQYFSFSEKNAKKLERNLQNTLIKSDINWR